MITLDEQEDWLKGSLESAQMMGHKREAETIRAILATLRSVKAEPGDHIEVFKMTTGSGATAFYGVESAARAAARSTGIVTPMRIPRKDFALVTAAPKAEPKSGHCLLDVPQNSPCAMAGHCVGKQAEPDGCVVTDAMVEAFKKTYEEHSIRQSLQAALAAAPAAPGRMK